MRAVFQATASALTFLVLVACSTSRAVAPTASNPPPPLPEEGAVGPGAEFAGLWYVSGVFPAAAARASIADPHLGAALVIDAAEVSDVNGQRCVTPDFLADKVDTLVIGLQSAPAGDWDRLVVTCAGKAFATYIQIPAQSLARGKDTTGMVLPALQNALVQQRPEGLYLLEQPDRILHRLTSEPAAFAGEGEVSQMAPAAPALEVAAVQPVTKESSTAVTAPLELTPSAPKAMLEGPVAAQPEPAKATVTGDAALPAPGTAVHLASYKGSSAAKRGWKILLGEYDELDPLSPLYIPVDVPGKGAIIRLYAAGADEATLTRICAALKAKDVYCTLNP